MVQVALKDDALDIEETLGLGHQDFSCLILRALTLGVEQQAVMLQAGIFARALNGEGVVFLGQVISRVAHRKDR